MNKNAGIGKISMHYQSFKLTNNSKVRFSPKHNNTFSLTQGPPEEGGTCPMATEGPEGCLEVCYDKNLRKLYKAYAAVEDFNTSLVLGKTKEEMFCVIDNTVSKWLLTGGDKDPYFRIHTGGDFFNKTYASAWKDVMLKYPSVKFWAYTRSLFAVPVLLEAANLTLMLSCDPVNKDKVLKTYAEHKDNPNLGIAWMGDNMPEEISDRAVLDCPEVTGKTKNTKQLGACARCRVCIDRKLKTGKIRHVRFPIHR